MKSLSNGLQYDNQNFDPAFGEYLLGNGFKANYQGRILFFYNNKMRLQVAGPNLDLFIYQPDANVKTEREKMIFSQSHFGIAHMDMFMWMMLMHSMNIVSLSQFLQNAKQQDHQLYTEAKLLIRSLVHTQIPNVA